MTASCTEQAIERIRALLQRLFVVLQASEERRAREGGSQRLWREGLQLQFHEHFTVEHRHVAVQVIGAVCDGGAVEVVDGEPALQRQAGEQGHRQQTDLALRHQAVEEPGRKYCECYVVTL